MKRPVTTTHLEMLSRDDLIPSTPRTAYSLGRAEIASPELNRFLYTAVGWRWAWAGRLAWDYERWQRYLSGPMETWIAYVSGTPAGYFELALQAAANVELAFFGLLPSFVGRGIGGALLSDAILRAWQTGAQRVWVHTCDLDHPRALANYRARGFRPFKVETTIEELPDTPLEPWPGARVDG